MSDTKLIEYKALGGDVAIKLSPQIVRTYLCQPTKSGKMPSDQDVMRYIMLCRSRQLNPWLGDAWLLGYDGKDGPVFSLITSVHALYKRAELNPAFDGIRSGVIVVGKDGTVTEREGQLVLDGEHLVAAWAIAFRKDRHHHGKHVANRAEYDLQNSQWRKMPSVMLSKCARALALRETFPRETSEMYEQAELPVQQPVHQLQPVGVTSFIGAAEPDPEPEPESRYKEPAGYESCGECGVACPPEVMEAGLCPECAGKVAK